jgi:hypothetical protein
VETKQFEKKIRHLDQIQVITGAISTLNKLLIDKGIVKSEELQSYFADWMREQKLTTRKSKNGRHK